MSKLENYIVLILVSTLLYLLLHQLLHLLNKKITNNKYFNNKYTYKIIKYILFTILFIVISIFYIKNREHIGIFNTVIQDNLHLIIKIYLLSLIIGNVLDILPDYDVINNIWLLTLFYLIILGGIVIFIV